MRCRFVSFLLLCFLSVSVAGCGSGPEGQLTYSDVIASPPSASSVLSPDTSVSRGHKIESDVMKPKPRDTVSSSGYNSTPVDDASSVSSGSSVSVPSVSVSSVTPLDSDKYGSLSEDSVSEDRQEYDHVNVSVSEEGWDVFRPDKAALDYRYGGSVIANGDSMDAYFAAPGDVPSELDCIIHTHSSDGGHTWDKGSVVLTPMPLSRDSRSVCDPDVFYHDGYYYMGYTGTMDATNKGIANNVFVARSVSMDGPFEKWNGKGWGGDPVPLVCYTGPRNSWGTGEPSFVIHDGTLYVYCTEAGVGTDGGPLCQTSVYTADLGDDDWPSRLSFKGYAVNRTNGFVDDEGYMYLDSDSWDVAYDDECSMFIAIATNRRFTAASCLLAYESHDGISFNRISEINDNVLCGCHNAGFVSDGQGHFPDDEGRFVVYSYGGTGNQWGVWSAHMSPFDVTGADDIDRDDDGGDNVKAVLTYGQGTGKIRAASVVADLINYRVAGGVSPSLAASYRSADGKVSSFQFDAPPDTVSDNGGSLGVTVSHNGANRQVKFCTLEPDVFLTKDIMHGGVRRFFLPVGSYQLSLSGKYLTSIKPFIEYKDYFLQELSPVDITSCNVTFVSRDPAVCGVFPDGRLAPLSEGSTVIDVSFGGVASFQIDVKVIP